MSTMLVTKTDTGKLVGFGDKNKRAYARFKKALDTMEPGELIEFSFWFPRHGKFHRLHFAMLNQVFESQEVFRKLEHLRGWLEVGAGHAVFVKGPNGRTMAMPDSISYKRLDDEQFKDHHEKVKAFLRGSRARRFLWPHLKKPQAVEMVEAILAPFERDDWIGHGG